MFLTLTLSLSKWEGEPWGFSVACKCDSRGHALPFAGYRLPEGVRRIDAEDGHLTGEEAELFKGQAHRFLVRMSLEELGFYAKSRGQRLAVNRDEIEAARWFSREELIASPEDESLRLPRRDSIARRLINEWLAETG